MVITEEIGLDDLGQDWLGPLVSAVAQTGLAIYKGVAEQKAIRKAAEAETAAQAAAAAQAAQAAQAQLTMAKRSESMPGDYKISTLIWAGAALAGVLILGTVGYFVLRSSDR